jgi:hypothetical protein
MRENTVDVLNAKKWEAMEIFVLDLQRHVRAYNAVLEMGERKEERRRKIVSQIVISSMN